VKLISEQNGIRRLRDLKDTFRESIASGYEHRAKDCLTCETPGACCLDAHFVNVRISRLESAAIKGVLDRLEPEHRALVDERIAKSIDQYSLTAGGSETYACPLFERGAGCLVHSEAKPAACITHACYENPADLPPDELLTDAEERIDALNKQVYSVAAPWLPLPLAIRKPQ